MRKTSEGGGTAPKTVLFPADVGEPFPLYPRILSDYLSKDRPNIELLVYLPEERSNEAHIYAIERILEKYNASDNYVVLQTGMTLDEHTLFQGADYYVTTRAQETIHRTCLADRYGVKILYGTDIPIFPEDLT